jgi:DNA invertase Pin-like site-specific DNA recombinase
VFTDKASGKDTRRPELERLLAFVREGDTVVVHSMDRLARNLDDLRRLVQSSPSAACASSSSRSI